MDYINFSLKSRPVIKKNEYIKTITTLTIFVICLVFIYSKNNLLFHNVVEIFIIIIAFSILIIALNNYDISRDHIFMFLGVAFGFVGGFQLLHIVIYSNISIFGENTMNLAIQVWIVSSYIQAFSIIIATIMKNKPINFYIVIIVYTLISSLSLLAIFQWNIFPVCYSNESGITMFKIVNEYIISFILLLSLILTVRRKKDFDTNVYYFIIISFSTLIASEISYANYTYIYNVFNMIGHILKMISFFFVYKAFVVINIKIPFQLLNQSNSKLQEINNLLKQEIYERKLIQEKLSESEEHYHWLVEQMPDSVIIHDFNVIIFGNSAATKLLNVSTPKDLDGVSIFNFLHRDYHELINKHSQMFKSGENYPLMIEAVLVRTDSTLLDVEITSFAFMYKENQVYMSIIHDLSDQKKVNELQKNIEKEQKLLSEALQFDKLRTEFFSNISHELRTPLNVILSTLQLLDLYLKKDILQDDEQNIHKHIKIMKQNCFRLLRLLNNIIDISKIDSGFMSLQLQNRDIVSTIEDITLSIINYVQAKGITLIFDTNVEEKNMVFDPDKIERIMLNLLSNAIKFTEPGGNISVNLYNKGDNIIISVKDTGIGIPEQKQDIIFERFRQVDETLSRNSEGSGIGLSLVKSFVEMHDGKISVKSDYGKGSEFIIELPVYIQVIQDIALTQIQSHIHENNTLKATIEFSDIYS